MKILLTGGGTGGHFYPLIAVAQQVRAIVVEEKLIEPKLYFMAPDAYNEEILFENDIKFVKIRTGKIRRYFSFKNLADGLKIVWGVIEAIFKMFMIFPDVVFGKGGYGSFPTLFAARLLRIPVVIHESDTIPGQVNLWAGRFAKRVAVSYPDALQYFPKERSAVTGNPIRSEILNPIVIGAHEFLDLDKSVPIIFIVGGSQGSQRLNDTVLQILPPLLKKYQIIHQVGKSNYADCELRTKVILENDRLAKHYKLFDYLNNTALRMTAGVAELVISRAGSALFEFANWGLPAIVIPIPEAVSHNQHENAFTYARNGCAQVIEENNLSPSVLLSEIDRLMDDKALRGEMSKAGKAFASPEAARTIAKEILGLAIKHE